MDLFSANGWANIGAMVEAAKNTIWEEKVNELIKKIWVKNDVKKPSVTKSNNNKIWNSNTFKSKPLDSSKNIK